MSKDEGVMDALRATLMGVSLAHLKEYAQQKGVKYREGANKSEIIELLLATSPGELLDLVGNAIRLELKSVENGIASNLKVTEGSLIAALNKSQSEMREELAKRETGIKNDVSVKIAEGLKGVDQLRWMFGAIAGILSLATVLGGGYTIFKFVDVETTLKKIHETEAKMVRLTSDQRRYHTEVIAHDIIEVMASFTSSLPDKELLELVAMHKVTVEGWLMESGGRMADDGERSILEYIRDVLSCLDAVNYFRMDLTSATRRAAAIDLWKAIRPPTATNVASPSCSLLVSRGEAYKHHAMGTLVLTRPRGGAALTATDVDSAVKAFTIAVESYAGYACAYNNHARAIFTKYQQLPKTPETLAMRGHMLDECKALVQKALALEQPQRQLSILWNNAAYYALEEALLFCEKCDFDGERALIKQAQEYCQRASLLAERHSVVHVTNAEIRSQSLRSNPEIKTWDNIKKAEELSEIVGLLRTAHLLGYPGFDGVNSGAELVEKFPTLKQMEVLSRSYTSKLDEFLKDGRS